MVYIPMDQSAGEVLASLEAHVQRLNGHEEVLRQREERIHQCEKEVQRREAELMCIDKEHHSKSEQLAHKESDLKRIEAVLKSRAVEIEQKEGELKAKEAHLALREAVLKAEGDDKEAVGSTENGLGEGLKLQVSPTTRKRGRPVKTAPIGTANAPSMEPMAKVAAEVAISSRAPLARTMNFRQMRESLTEEQAVGTKKSKSVEAKRTKRTCNVGKTTGQRRPQRYHGYRLYKTEKLAELATQGIRPPHAFRVVATGWKELKAANRSEWGVRANEKNRQRDAEMVGAEDGENEGPDE